MKTLRRFALIMQNVLDTEKGEVLDFIILPGSQEMSDQEMLAFQNEWIHSTDFLKRRYPRYTCKGVARMLFDHEVDMVDDIVDEIKRENPA